MRTHGGGSGVRGVVVRVRAVEESECEGGDREAADAAKDAAEDVKEWLEELLNNKELYKFLVLPMIDGDKKKTER
jgi:hypothetical protein